MAAQVGGLDAHAGDLDRPRAYWSVIKQQLGGDTVLTVEDTIYRQDTTSGIIISAFNSCVRKWATHLGVYARVPLTGVSAKYLYALPDSLIEDGTAAKPFRVYVTRPDSSILYGYARVEKPEDIGTASNTSRRLFDVVDDHLWINKVDENDIISLYGPVEGGTVTHGADTTNVPTDDRNAVCDCATALVADQVGLQSVAVKYWGYFVSHVLARGGTMPTGGPTQ